MRLSPKWLTVFSTPYTDMKMDELAREVVNVLCFHGSVQERDRENATYLVTLVLERTWGAENEKQ